MFPASYFGKRYFAARYFGMGADAAPSTGGSFGGKLMIYDDDEEGWF